jgi:glycosyltransferase involved in cell wall biosynthesis
MTIEMLTVALPVLNGEPHLEETLRAVRRQRAPAPVELLVADSGSRDRSVEIALGYGARVIEIPRGSFSHGGTRNRLMDEATGSRVAFLTQDAVPASEDWLERLLAGFELADDVALVYGPYLPRHDASHTVRREFEEMFGQMAPDGQPRVDRLDPGARSGELRPGPVTFFTDANGCVLREAWERVPFRPVRYAEDQLLAQDMLRAGYAKVYEPRAPVVHSHDYPPLAQFQRFFDEFRGLREVYGHVEEAGMRHTLGTIRNQVAADRRWLRNQGVAGRELDRATLQSLRFFGLRAAGSIAGSRADSLPSPLRGLCSLEGRKSFEPAER